VPPKNNPDVDPVTPVTEKTKRALQEEAMPARTMADLMSEIKRGNDLLERER
jgi:hypothetical protein